MPKLQQIIITIPLRFFPSWTCLNRLLALSTMVLVKLILSAIELISLIAFSNALSDEFIVLLFWYLDMPKPSNEASPRPGPIIVERSEPLSRGFSAPPTREGSTPVFSLLKVLHSDPTSMTLWKNIESYNKIKDS